METLQNFCVMIHMCIFIGIPTIVCRYWKWDLHPRNIPLIGVFRQLFHIMFVVHKTPLLIFSRPYHHSLLNTAFKALWLKLGWNSITFPPGNKSQCWPHLAGWTGLILGCVINNCKLLLRVRRVHTSAYSRIIKYFLYLKYILGMTIHPCFPQAAWAYSCCFKIVIVFLSLPKSISVWIIYMVTIVMQTRKIQYL